MGGFMIYRWNILDIYPNSEGSIIQARYLLTLTDGDDFVSTEGYYNFNNLQATRVFPELTENQVVYWIENDGSQDFVDTIKSRLAEQMETIKAGTGPIRAPWLGAETFTVSL